jgi:catechol 2,3-dioxygenase-like lactoylglutathione lyase family enzyme
MSMGEDLPPDEFGTTFAHVAIPCRDVSASSDFYARLGFRPGFTKHDDAGKPILRQMVLGGQFVELIAQAQDRPAARPPEQGHFGLRVKDADAAYDRLIRAGHRPDAQPRTGKSGVRFWFLADPDGNWIEFVSD